MLLHRSSLRSRDDSPNSQVLMAPGAHVQHSPGWIHRRSFARIEMGAVSAFHFGVAVVIESFPRERIITPGTSTIFGTIPLHVWAVWFVLAGLSSAACVHRNTDVRQALTWILVFPTGAGWVYGISYAVSQGRGNVIFALAWAFLLLWWLILALRLHFGGSGTSWDGSSD